MDAIPSRRTGRAIGPNFSAPAVLTRLASEVARLGGWELVLASGAVYWDDNVAAMHGLPNVQQLTREQALERYAPESRRRFEAHLAACAAEGTPFDDEFEVAAPAGDPVWFRAMGRALRDARGKVVSIHGACQDVTEMRQARDRALRLGEQLQATIESMSDAFLMLDHAYRIVYINQIAVRMVGRPRRRLIGAVIWEQLPPAASGKFKSETVRAMTQRIPLVFEESAAAPTSRWFEVRQFPTPDGGLAIYFSDITDRKLAEAASRRTQAQAWQAQKMESLGTLAGGIAHDFNNVLAAILGNTGLALDQLPPDHAVRANLDHIQRAGEHARKLVRRILQFSRADSSAQDAIVQPLAPVVTEALHMLQMVLPAAVELRATPAADDLAVRVDATSIHQVLLNLCTNAWQALPAGKGWIEIDVKAATLTESEAQRLAPPLPAGDYAHLRVIDSGVGIDEATRERLFEPFFTTKPTGEGTGLGLPVVHGIVTAHGGAVAIDSAPGRGTTFHVYLPQARLAQGTPQPSIPAGAGKPSARARARGAGQRVLLVDDDPVVLLATEHILRQLGYEVSSHSDPSEALASAKRAPEAVDVVVSDFSMPKLSGLELAKELMDVRPGMPIVISSGYLSDDMRRQAERSGVVTIVRKENLFEEIGDAVDRALHATGTPQRG